jgi:hypothetical protein
MYTELYLAVQIKPSAPMDVLEYMFNGGEEPAQLPDHEFFKCDRWHSVGSGSSFYFVPDALSKLFPPNHTGSRTLITRSDLKNYDGEILKFIDWIDPYIDASDGDHIGHHRYEEEELPTLLYWNETCS